MTAEARSARGLEQRVDDECTSGASINTGLRMMLLNRRCGFQDPCGDASINTGLRMMLLNRRRGFQGPTSAVLASILE
jgi:hypothetical protein